MITLTDEGYACRVAVEGVGIARQLIAMLSRSFAFQTSEPLSMGVPPAPCVFRVAYGSQLTQKDIVRLLSPIAGLRFNVEPPVR